MNTIECDKCGQKITGDHRKYNEWVVQASRENNIPERTLHLCLVCVDPFNRWLKEGK